MPPPVQHVHRLDEVSAEFLVAAQAGKAGDQADEKQDGEKAPAKKA